VLGCGGFGQRLLLGQVLAQHLEEHVVGEAFERIDVDALGFQAGVVLAVHDAVLALLAHEVLDLGQQLGVADLIAEVAYAGDEVALAFGEDGGHRVKEPGLEGVASEPVLGDVAVEPEVELFAGNDGVVVFHGGLLEECADVAQACRWLSDSRLPASMGLPVSFSSFSHGS